MNAGVLMQNPYVVLFGVILGLVLIIIIGIIGVGLMVWLPRAILAMGIGLVGLLGLFQKLPWKGPTGVYIGLGCFVVAFVVGTGMIGI
jgi:hypothetical protein